MSEYSVFKPKSERGIFADYPELKKLKAFSSLKSVEMLFVWYLACESSPVNNHTERLKLRERVEEAGKNSYFANGRKLITDVEFDNMLDGKFPDKLSEAIRQMEKFKVGPRVRAKQMTEKAFDNIEKILNIDAGERSHFLNKDGEVDFAKKKAYVDTVEKGLKIMPQIVETLEGGYRLTENEKDDEEMSEDGGSLIDTYHTQED